MNPLPTRISQIAWTFHGFHGFRRLASRVAAVTAVQDPGAALQAMKLAPQLYAQIHVFSFSYLVTKGDKLYLPYRLKDASIGDMLRLSKATRIGSREHTIVGDPLVEEGAFECLARVIEITKNPMQFTHKTKRRQRRVRTIKNKQDVTVLRIAELRLQ